MTRSVPGRLALLLGPGGVVLGAMVFGAVAFVLSAPMADRSEPSASRTPAAEGHRQPTAAAPASGTTADEPSDGIHYVAVGGDDDAPGTKERPWGTLQHAADVARGTVLVAPGSHDGFVLSRPDVEFRAIDGAEVIITEPVQVIGTEDVTLHGMIFEGATGPYEAAILIERCRSVAIRESTIRNSTFGIHLREVADVEIAANEITHNGSGIEIHGAADAVTVARNEIHHNDRPVDASRGANGVALYRATGPIEITDNRIYANYNPAPSPEVDPGGGAIELFATSGVRIEGNQIWDNSVLETGTEDGLPCTGIIFTRNVAYRGPAPTVQDGLVLRCAKDSLVAHNTMDGLDRFAFDVIHLAGPFAGSVEGLQIVNNIIVNGRAYGIDNELPPSVEIDHNLTWNPGSEAEFGEFLAYVAGLGNTTSFAEMQAWGIDRNGVHADPLFVGQAERDYRLQADSPAIGRAVPLGESDALSAGPNLGRWDQ